LKPINRFNPTKYVCRSQARNRIFNAIFRIRFCVQWFVVGVESLFCWFWWDWWLSVFNKCLKISTGYSESVKWRRTDNTMRKWQTMIYKALFRKREIEHMAFTEMIH